MKHKSFLILIIFSLFLIFNSCSDEPSSIGIELITGDLIVVKTFDSQIDSIDQSSSFFKNVVPLGASSLVLIGKYQDIDASTLLRFIFGLSDTLKQDVLDGKITVTDSWIVLRNRYEFGDTLASMEFTAHNVTSDWSASFTIDSLSKLQYDASDISSNTDITDSTYKFNIDESLVFTWMRNAADITLESNYGIYIKPSATSGKVIGFEAITAIPIETAKLFVVIEKAGVYTDTINGFILGDLSLVDGNLPTLPAGLIAVQSGITVNSKIKFDISVLPKGLVVNSANLIFTKDESNSIHGSVYNSGLRASYLSSNDSLNTTGNPITLSLSDGKYTGDITTFLRNWIRENENYGLLIRTANQIDGLELFSIYGSDATDSLVRPRLRVTYTIKENF